MPETYAQLLRDATERLQQTSDSPRLDAELLLAHLLDRPRTHLLAWPERVLSAELISQFATLIRERARGVPVAYLTGRRDFYNLTLTVTAATLVPRPETELLVELALAQCDKTHASVLDLGTGSGAIALALAAAKPHWQVVATDRMADALQVARENVRLNNLTNVELRQGVWYAPVAGQQFDLILSNPPYVAADDPHLTRGDLPHEPRAALVGRGVAGLDDLRDIVASAPAHLRADGWLLVEHGATQAPPLGQMLQAAGFDQIGCWRDLAGLDRVSGGRWPGM